MHSILWDDDLSDVRNIQCSSHNHIDALLSAMCSKVSVMAFFIMSLAIASPKNVCWFSMALTLLIHQHFCLWDNENGTKTVLMLYKLKNAHGGMFCYTSTKQVQNSSTWSVTTCCLCRRFLYHTVEFLAFNTCPERAVNIQLNIGQHLSDIKSFRFLAATTEQDAQK